MGANKNHFREACVQLVGEFPASWDATTLGEICKRDNGSIQTGPFGSQLHASDYVLHGIPSIMPKNIGDNRIITEGIARISQEDAERLKRHRVIPGDIVYSRRGDVEKCVLIREQERGWLCGTGCMRIRFGSNSIDPAFAFYYLSHPNVRKWIVQHAIGATMPNLNNSILSAIPFVLPSFKEQQTIAYILSTLDDKIELNRRMNQTLEEIARTLFKSWFVDFDPVRAKIDGREDGLPEEIMGLFPDTFEDSALGKIPRGWHVGRFGDIANNIRRTIHPDEIEPNTPYIGLQHIPQKSIALSDWGKADEVVSNKFGLKTGEILFGKLRSYFHKVGVAPLDGVCSTDILVVAPKIDDWFGYLLGHISSVEFVDYTTSVSMGTRMPRTSWHDMARFEIVLPPDNLAKVFNAHGLSIVEMIRKNIHQARSLAVSRDLLLPKLINGEVGVMNLINGVNL